MTNNDRFIPLVEIFKSGGYPQEWGPTKRIMDLLMAKTEKEREKVIDMALDDGLKIDDYIAIKTLFKE